MTQIFTAKDCGTPIGDHEPAPKARDALAQAARPGKPAYKNATGLKGRANARGVEREARPYRPPTFHHIHTQAWRPGLRKTGPSGLMKFQGALERAGTSDFLRVLGP